MSIAVQVVCDRGFQSDVIMEGFISEGEQVYKLPVFVPSSGKLIGVKFREADIGLRDMAGPTHQKFAVSSTFCK